MVQKVAGKKVAGTKVTTRFRNRAVLEDHGQCQRRRPRLPDLLAQLLPLLDGNSPKTRTLPRLALAGSRCKLKALLPDLGQCLCQLSTWQGCSPCPLWITPLGRRVTIQIGIRQCLARKLLCRETWIKLL